MSMEDKIKPVNSNLNGSLGIPIEKPPEKIDSPNLEKNQRSRGVTEAVKQKFSHFAQSIISSSEESVTKIKRRFTEAKKKSPSPQKKNIFQKIFSTKPASPAKTETSPPIKIIEEDSPYHPIYARVSPQKTEIAKDEEDSPYRPILGDIGAKIQSPVTSEYQPIKLEKETVSPTPQPPLTSETAAPKNQPGIKKTLGYGLIKIFSELKKEGQLTKELLHRIKLRDRALPSAKVQEMIPALKEMSVPLEKKERFDSVLSELSKYSEMSLKEQAILSKKLLRLLNESIPLSDKDVGLIIKRDFRDFLKSLKNKKQKLNLSQNNPQNNKNIEHLEDVLNLWRAGKGHASQISELYSKLPEEKKLALNQFLTGYLKGKRERAVLGEAKANTPNFKEVEIQPIIDLRSALISLDKKLEKEKGNTVREAELLKIHEWSDHIAVPGISEDGKSVEAKKFKFGNLKELVNKQEEEFANQDFKFSSKEMLKGMTAVAKGVAALHALGYIHRDISLRNILVTDQVEFVINHETGQLEKQYSYRCALSDFGRMKDLKGQPVVKFNRKDEQPIKWLANEEIFFEESSKKTDVHSFGITMLELLLGNKNFNHIFDLKAKALRNPELKEYTFNAFEEFDKYCKDHHLKVDPDLLHLIEGCLEDDPNKRPTMEQVVNVLENDVIHFGLFQ